MFCKYCGKETIGDLDICSACGQAIEAASKEKASAQIIPSEAVSTEEASTDAFIDSKAIVENTSIPVTDENASQDAYSNGFEDTQAQGFYYYGMVADQEGFYAPPAPVKKKKIKWPFVVLAVVLCCVVGVAVLVKVIFEQPQYVIGMAYEKTFVESDSYSMDVTIDDGESEIEFEVQFSRGETRDEDVVYIEMGIPVEGIEISLEIGICDGKFYSSFGEIELYGETDFEELEELLEEEYDVDVDLEKIFEKLSSKDLTDEELAELFDGDIFPVLEKIIEVDCDEEVEFPPFSDIKSSIDAFFGDDFVDNYILIEEKDISEGVLYEIEMDVKKVAEGFEDYARDDETLSQVSDILDILFDSEEEDSEDEEEIFDVEEFLDEEDLIFKGSLEINEDGYIDNFDIDFLGIKIEVKVKDINSTSIDESDVKDIEVLFNIFDEDILGGGQGGYYDDYYSDDYYGDDYYGDDYYGDDYYEFFYGDDYGDYDSDRFEFFYGEDYDDPGASGSTI